MQSNKTNIVGAAQRHVVQELTGMAEVPGTITVGEPQKQGDGIKAFISYKVGARGATVVRRYNDFVWLHGELEKQGSGCIVPPLPEKAALGRFDELFLQRRRRALERFLNRVAEHALLRGAKSFTAFLSAADLGAAKAESRSSGGTMMASMKQWFGETVHSAKQMMGAAEVESTAEDLAVLDEYGYVCGLEPQMRNVLKHTSLLVQRQREQGDALGEVGASFAALGASEGDAEVLGQALAALGVTAKQLGAIAKEQVENEQQYFEEPLTDYLQLVGAARRALEKRAEKQHTLNTAKAALDTKRQAHSRLVEKSAGAGSGGASTKGDSKVRASEQEMRKAEQQLLQTSEEAQLVTARVMDEMERFKREKLGDFQRISLDYVQLQIEACERQEKAWELLIPQLEVLDVEALETGGGSPRAAAATP